MPGRRRGALFCPFAVHILLPQAGNYKKIYPLIVGYSAIYLTKFGLFAPI